MFALRNDVPVIIRHRVHSGMHREVKLFHRQSHLVVGTRAVYPREWT